MDVFHPSAKSLILSTSEDVKLSLLANACSMCFTLSSHNDSAWFWSNNIVLFCIFSNAFERTKLASSARASEIRFTRFLQSSSFPGFICLYVEIAAPVKAIPPIPIREPFQNPNFQIEPINTANIAKSPIFDQSVVSENWRAFLVASGDCLKISAAVCHSIRGSSL